MARPGTPNPEAECVDLGVTIAIAFSLPSWPVVGFGIETTCEDDGARPSTVGEGVSRIGFVIVPGIRAWLAGMFEVASLLTGTPRQLL